MTNLSLNAVEPDLSDLGAMPLDALRELWRERYGPPPKLRSPELVRLMLAWRLQAERNVGLDVETRRQLRRPLPERARPVASVGARLVREWQGVPHEVTVASDGYLYAGERFGSLSEIARTITGTRWNGPRFFGLRKEP